MNARLCFLIVPALTCLVMSGCSGTREVHGQIFIATQGGDNVKLGLVEVSAIPEQVVNEYLDRKRQEADAEKTRLEQVAEKARSDSQRALASFEAAGDTSIAAMQQYREALAAVDRTPFNRMDEHIEHTRQLLNLKTDRERDLDEKSSQAKSAASAADLAKAQFDSWPTAEFYYKDIPKGVTQAVSDSDGHFVLHLAAKGRFVFAAHASRVVGASATEEYYWLVREDTARKDIAVVLSNRNIMTAQSPESAILAVAAKW